MSTKYNGLEPSEEELLAMLIEEAGEVIVEACKVLRHGKVATDHCTDPPTQYHNAASLAREIGELMTVADRLVHRGVISQTVIMSNTGPDVWVRKRRYTHQQLDSEAAMPGEHQEVLDAIRAHNSGEDE